ncbi:MAG: ANTAR domain-containing protein [Actinomycetota bacterium]|nr:ANTAR domain-containing protein [Actinomycetota bacterium]
MALTATNGLGDHSEQIAQAQGMVSAQVDCTLDEALLLMRARAASSDLSLAYIAKAILDGSIRFDD